MPSKERPSEVISRIRITGSYKDKETAGVLNHLRKLGFWVSSTPTAGLTEVCVDSNLGSTCYSEEGIDRFMETIEAIQK